MYIDIDVYIYIHTHTKHSRVPTLNLQSIKRVPPCVSGLKKSIPWAVCWYVLTCRKTSIGFGLRVGGVRFAVQSHDEHKKTCLQRHHARMPAHTTVRLLYLLLINTTSTTAASVASHITVATAIHICNALVASKPKL